MLLPAGVNLADYVGAGRQVFSARTVTGEARDFAVVPIINGHAYALGSAPAGAASVAQSLFGEAALVFPFLMWFVSLLVAVLMLRRQVIAPIRQLRMRMRGFADGRAILSGGTMASAPRELREIGDTFDVMAGKILRDEAELEDRLHERDLLLREVHHRVKNNLQLMSSIINMQIRQSGGAEAEEALRRVQGRLASLAKFHRDLYQSTSLTNLRADTLLTDLARQLTSVALDPARPIDLELDLDPVTMSPDQASPLAMLVTEAMTNAIKYASSDPGDRRFVRLSLALDPGSDPQTATVTIQNSVRRDEAAPTSAGLGTQLIRAFAVQLGAEVEKGRADGVFTKRVSFPIDPFPADGGTSQAV
jgi:two-component sensor histidine kinase